MTLHTYLPQDRLHAIANNTPLPDRTSGSALFADISGFTSLTEGLRESLGARQGAEELTRHLGVVYTALIAEIETYSGSVIGFAGDSMLCWFGEAVSGKYAPAQAVSCALALQIAMSSFSAIPLPGGRTVALTLKAAIATGPARRFVVGDPEIQKLDALAGAAVSRTAVGEHLAGKGEVLVDEATMRALGDAVVVTAWREDDESKERFAVVGQGSGFGGNGMVVIESQPPIPDSQLLKSWVHHIVYERELAGQESFLSEFRPCVAVFVRFTGIDYDTDSARAELDTFLRQMQNTASRYEGTLMDITIGDKGSYAYINFGALATHEDDARRAVKTALEVRNKTGLQLQMGITQGTLRVGAFGGATRRTFAALGDDVNLAARLMTTASVGEILISGHVHKAITNDFVSEPRPPLPMKGKAEPLPVFAVTGERQQRAIRLQEPTYALPMVGRTKELHVIHDKLELAVAGKSQIIGIVAEAGMGKSRLVAEVIRSARKRGFAGYGGSCQSDGVNTPYQPWKAIWQAFFDIDPSVSLNKQIRFLESQIKDSAHERAEAWPLLGIVLDLDIPDNDFTKTLEPQYRQSVLRALLEDCLRTGAKEEPLLIIIEDLHWIDALSHDLTEGLARALSDSRVCFVLAYRPPQLARLTAPRLEVMPNFTRIELHELNTSEAEQAIRAKLAQLYPARSGALPIGLVDKLMRRSQGNPFYLEELLNHVRDRGLDPAGLDQIELPDSLHTLILSRIDALTESEKTTLRVASIVGRMFRAKWLTGYYPDLGDFPKVRTDLDELAKMDITSLDTPEPELAYLFKHIVTHEVTYESLPFDTRARLHEQLAVYLENNGAPVESIAHHYGLSHNTAKQHEYWLKAGNAAHAAFANEAALDYYERLRPLLSEPMELGEIHLKCAEANFRLGRLAESRQHVNQALDFLGQPLPAGKGQLFSLFLVEIIKQVWHRFSLARQPVNTDVLQTPELDEDTVALIRAYDLLGYLDVLASQAGIVDIYYNLRVLNLYESARRRSPGLASAFSRMGYTAGVIPVHALARDFLRRAQATLNVQDHPPSRASALLFAGAYNIGIGKWTECERAYQQALEIFDRLGDGRNWAFSFAGLGFSAYFQGQFARCLNRGAELYKTAQAGNNIEHQVWGLNFQATCLLRQGQTSHAAALLETVSSLLADITDSRLTELYYWGASAVTHLKQGHWKHAHEAAATCARLLALAPIPYFSSLEGYSDVAEVYLTLWEKEKSQVLYVESNMEINAKQACRALHRFARIYPIAKPRALLWQGLCDWLDGKPGRARRAWQKSLAAAQKLAMPYDEALACYEIGRHATGEEQKSNLARAGEIFERLGVVRFDIQPDNFGK